MSMVENCCSLTVTMGELDAGNYVSVVPMLFRCVRCSIDTTVIIGLGLTVTVKDSQALRKMIEIEFRDRDSVAFKNLRATRAAIVKKYCEALKAL